MPNIFISYRREDNPALVGRIYDRLQVHFGEQSVFIDTDTLPLGVDFRKHLNDAISKCQVLLAVIGNNWFGNRPDGTRRLDDPNDFIRIEIEAALKRGIPVIPILIGATPMPKENDLPEALSGLSYRNSIRIDPSLDFHNHVNRLISGLTKLLKEGDHPKEQSHSLKIKSASPLVKNNFDKAIIRGLIAAPAGAVIMLAFGRVLHKDNGYEAEDTTLGFGLGLTIGIITVFIPRFVGFIKHRSMSKNQEDRIKLSTIVLVILAFVIPMWSITLPLCLLLAYISYKKPWPI